MLQYTIFLILAPISIVAMIATNILVWRYQIASSINSFFWSLACITCYLVANLLELISPTATSTLIWAKLNYIFIALQPVAWLVFSLEYSRYYQWLKLRSFSLLLIIPAITILLAQTNEMHHLIWHSYTFIPVSSDMMLMKVSSYGFWFWVHAVYSYSLIILGIVVIVRQYFTSHTLYRQQSVLVVVASFLPLVANIIYVSHIFPGWSKDYSPVAFAITCIFITISILRYRLLDLTPIARDTLIDRMGVGLIVVDHINRLIDINPAGLSSLNLSSDDLIGCPLDNVLPVDCSEILPSNSDEKTSEICLNHGEARPTYYESRSIRMIDRRGNLLGHLITLHNTTAYKELLNRVEELARTDVLTGIYNRRYLIEIAQNELDRSRRYMIPFSIILIDVDHFKENNDRHGHQTGDIVLKTIACRLNSCLRSSDILARYGGDEFIVLLPETSETAADRVARRLLTSVDSSPIVCSGVNIIATISIGLSSDSGLSDANLDQMLEYADRALYRSKLAGRNRTTTHQCDRDPGI